MQFEQEIDNEFLDIIKLQNSLLKRKMYKFVPKKHSNNNTKIDEFYNPLLDIELESSSKKFFTFASCPSCFQYFSNQTNELETIINGKHESIIEIIEPVNVIVKPAIKIDAFFGIIDDKEGEINFLVLCEGCSEEIGFFNFNKNRYFLSRCLK